MAAGALHVGASGSVKEAFDWKCYLNCYKILKNLEKLRTIEVKIQENKEILKQVDN